LCCFFPAALVKNFLFKCNNPDLGNPNAAYLRFLEFCFAEVGSKHELVDQHAQTTYSPILYD
jgi:hypothetical protein